jgi:hypothetical protein
VKYLHWKLETNVRDFWLIRVLSGSSNFPRSFPSDTRILVMVVLDSRRKVKISLKIYTNWFNDECDNFAIIMRIWNADVKCIFIYDYILWILQISWKYIPQGAKTKANHVKLPDTDRHDDNSIKPVLSKDLITI